jgi:hypothetical protein
MEKVVILSSGKRSGKTYEMIMSNIINLQLNVENITKRLDEMEKHIKDIDMDMNDLFDDVEGKHENNHK